MKKQHLQHLYWRVGFGISPNLLSALSKKHTSKVVDELFKASNTYTRLELDTSDLKDLMGNESSKMSKNTRKYFQRLSKEKTNELNKAWVDRLSETNQVLREKMTLFWTNHFVCEDNNFIYTQQFHNTLRHHALGNFGDFVKAISKEATMTKYLNTQQNKKQKPNENFARELMELFTLGVGHYTEQDIKESARAFTGYGHDLEGNFVLRKRLHDEDNKTFFGKTGNFTGDDIIDIILEQKQCAKYICEKLYRYFVNNTINKSNVDEMVQVFYPDYNIETLMRHVLVSDWFYDEANIGTKIKSPIEFLVGIKRLVPAEFNNPKQLLYIQKILGQTLFDPPNVAGWKGGRSWIDSNTIVTRLKLPSVLLNNAYIPKVNTTTAKTHLMEHSNNKPKSGKWINVHANWTFFEANFKKVAIDDLPNHILMCNLNQGTKNYLNTLAKVSKKEYCLQLMSLPEYQMC